MMLASPPQNPSTHSLKFPLTSPLYLKLKEKLNFIIYNKISLAFQPFEYDEVEREAAQLEEDHVQIQQDVTAENEENLEPVSVTTFDELKEQLTANVENLRCLWENHKDMLFSFNQVSLSINVNFAIFSNN